MLFPYAKSNLRKYWKDNPEPLFERTTLFWVAHQCKALTYGLLRIHRYSDTIPAKVGTKLTDHLYARHGDIKVSFEWQVNGMNLLYLTVQGARFAFVLFNVSRH